MSNSQQNNKKNKNQYNNINCKQLRSQFPYNCVHTLTFLLNVMMAYQAKTCCWIDTGI